MPIKIPRGLPAHDTLASENIFVMSEVRAKQQDIRPLQIAILNLMPTKTETETQLIRLLSNTPLQVELTLLQTKTYQSKNTSADYLESFYKSFKEVEHKKFDGFIITGAPVETLAFEEVEYWAELCEIMEWTKTHVYSTLHICWGAQAGLYYHHKVGKHPLTKKMSGVFSHYVEQPSHPLLRGFDEVFPAPHSRYTETRREDVEKVGDLEVLCESPEAGLYLVAAKNRRQFYVTGHSEYEAGTLAAEYFRDLERGLNPEVPVNYFPQDNPENQPRNRWRSHAHLLFSNWLNYFVYQETAYEIEEISAIL